MAIKPAARQRRPDTLCAAKLYLDEVQQITDILILAASAENGPKAAVKYRVADSECETIEDLHQIGGRLNEFEINVEGGVSTRSSLSISRYYTTLHLHGLKEDQFWITYGQIRDIFDVNSIWWTNAIQSLLDRIPWWLFILFVPYFFFYLAYFLPKSIQHNLTHPLGWVANVAGWLAGSLLVWLLIFRHSVVILNWSHEKGLRTWFRAHGTQVALVIAGALLGAFAKAIVDHLWPNR